MAAPACMSRLARLTGNVPGGKRTSIADGVYALGATALLLCVLNSPAFDALLQAGLSMALWFRAVTTLAPCYAPTGEG